MRSATGWAARQTGTSSHDCSEIPASIFLIGFTAVGWPKNGDVIVPL